MFVRRHYYDLNTGKTVLSYMRQGAILQGSVEEDFEFYPELYNKTANEVGVMEWLNPDEELEGMFRTHDFVKVDEGQLVFYDNPVTEKPTYDELLAAYNILTGGNDNE